MLRMLMMMLLATTETWAGHHALWGTSHVPILGKQTTRSDMYVLIDIDRQESGLSITQRTCHIVMQDMMFVQTSIASAELSKLPDDHFFLQRTHPNAYNTCYQTHWPDRDIDNNNKPGISIDINAPLCSGKISISMQSETCMQVEDLGSEILAKTTVHMQQKVLGASNRLLRFYSTDQQDSMHGLMRFKPVAQHTQCSDLHLSHWPDIIH